MKVYYLDDACRHSRRNGRGVQDLLKGGQTSFVISMVKATCIHIPTFHIRKSHNSLGFQNSATIKFLYG